MMQEKTDLFRVCSWNRPIPGPHPEEAKSKTCKHMSGETTRVEFSKGE